ncbi:hypothetical protein ACFL6Y_05655 [Elusimicrobiota bacterium]
MEEIRESASQVLVMDPELKIERIASSDKPTELDDFEASVDLELGRKPQIMSSGFMDAYGNDARWISQRTLSMLQDEVSQNGPIDYIQKFRVSLDGKTQEVLVVDDGSTVRVMLAEDY